ncbi:hypothetical protein JW921_03295 [Candidatus Fermentibacterales bacterium]|nr:hypothetical protein [Candidatus Fermentibacterales bacterium]
MKRLIAVSVVSLLIVMAGCDLFGIDETRGYVTGHIYEDAAHTIPAEGVWLFLEGDTTTVYSQSCLTDVNGWYIMDVQIYPEIVEGEGGGVTYSFPDEIPIGFYAYDADQDSAYIFCTKQTNPMTLGVGDTLYLWSIDINDFHDVPPGGGGSGGGGN